MPAVLSNIIKKYYLKQQTIAPLTAVAVFIRKMERNNTLTNTESESIENLLIDLQGKKKRKEEELREVKFVIGILERIQGSSGKAKNKPLVQLTTNAKKDIPKNIEKILEKHKKLHYEVIYEKLVESGINTTMESVKALLYGYSNREDKFRKIEPGIFGLLRK